MGYESHVAIALLAQDFEHMLECVPGESLDLLYAADVRTVARRDGSQYVVLQWSHQKWYRGFEEVDGIEKFLARIPHEFLRSGEELEDVEHHNTSDSFDMLFVQKQVVVFP